MINFNNGYSCSKVYALLLLCLFLPVNLPAFDVPIWDSTARWSTSATEDCGSGVTGDLGGPRLEIMSATAIPHDPIIIGPDAGPYGLLTYDSILDRIHLVAGSGARGYLDGPFEVARMGGSDYGARKMMAISPGRCFISEVQETAPGVPYGQYPIRCVDFVKQEIKTIPVNLPYAAGTICDSQGRLYIVSAYAQTITIYDPADGEIEVKTISTTGLGGGWNGLGLALDEKNGRLYVCRMNDAAYYISYWDLSDGSYHGVLPKNGQPLRAQNEAGPFVGTLLYPEMSISFGQDDPDGRFLYVYPNDTPTIFRLDLQTQIIWALSKESEGTRFISSGMPKTFSGWTLRFNNQGDLTTDIPFWNWPRIVAMKRTK